MKQVGPKAPIKAILINPPGQYFSFIGKDIANKYGLVYVSLKEILADQIAKQTDVGKLAYNNLKKGDLCKVILLV